MKTNPLLSLDFDQIQWWHTDDIELLMTIQVGNEKEPRKFKFESVAEMQSAYSEYFCIGKFSNKKQDSN